MRTNLWRTLVLTGCVVVWTTVGTACDSDDKCGDGSCQPGTDTMSTGADSGSNSEQDLGSSTESDSSGNNQQDLGPISEDAGTASQDIQAPGDMSVQPVDTQVNSDDTILIDECDGFLSAGDTCVTDDGIATETTDTSSEDVGTTPADVGQPIEDDTTNTIPDNKNPLGASVKLTIEPFEVKPGTERQVCKHINLPADVEVDVVRIHSTMSGTSHHFNLYKVIDGTAFDVVTGKQATVHDCSPASEQLAGDAAYIFGAATPERTFDTPKGVAFHLYPGQKLILEQHVINYTAGPVEGGVDLELFFAAPEATIEHHADILWLANWGFFLPPFSEVSDTALCKMPYDVEIIGVMSHFHELGTHFTVDAWTPEKTTQIYEDDDWAHPKFEEYFPPVSLQKGHGLQWTCTWNNTKSKLVMPGKNSTDEMCITFALGYPKNTLSDKPIQCNITN